MTDSMQAVLEQDICAIVANDLPWERLSGARVVVTGAAGFLGNYFVRTMMALHRLGKVGGPVQVVAMVRGLEWARSRFADLLGTGPVELVDWDFNTLGVARAHRGRIDDAVVRLVQRRAVPEVEPGRGLQVSSGDEPGLVGRIRCEALDARACGTVGTQAALNASRGLKA